MKQVIAFILLPVSFVLVLLELVWEFFEPVVSNVSDGIKAILEINYNFWAKKFKWEDGE